VSTCPADRRSPLVEVVQIGYGHNGLCRPRRHQGPLELNHHESDLIATIAIALTSAFVGGFIARRLRLPPIVGYLLAGVAVGPYTPGLVANQGIALELAEIGVVLLMFGVGLHFSVKDLLAVRDIAVPGALAQIAAATGMGIGVGLAIGWGLGAALVLGLAVSVASTVVLLRTLERRDLLASEAGLVAVGWLIVEDLFTVIALVILPPLAGVLGTGTGATPTALDVAGDVGLALGKAVALSALMLIAGARSLPWLLDRVERERSRELFTLAVLTIAVGIAFAASVVFDVSLALGAFLAGAVLSASHLSDRAARDILPLSDTFGVVFFVSVGMLLDPSRLIAHPAALLAVVLVVVLGKTLIALLIVAARRKPLRTGLTVAAGLAQVGEFSFIVATAGRTLGLLPEQGFQLVVATAVVSITLNPFLFAAVEPIHAWVQRHQGLSRVLRGSAAGES
jgi:monovalent cation:H+ antiporter-2, CPA2 family